MADWPTHDARVDIGISSGGDTSDGEGNIRVMLPGGIMVFDIAMPFADFALAVLRSRGAARAKLRIYAPELAGAEMEEKTVTVAWSGAYGPLGEESKAATLKPYEVDGWRGSRSDLGNMHRRKRGTDTWEVTFTRHMLLGHPVEPVPDIAQAVQAAQRALAELEALPEPIATSHGALLQAIAILRDGLGR